MYLFCAHPHLYSWTVISQGNASSPFVVVRDGIILDACPDTLARGVQPGMAQKQAKAMVEGLQMIPWDPETYEQASRNWCNTYLPYTNDLMRLEQHELIIPLSAHPNPKAIAEKIIQADAPGIRHGIGNAIWTAQIDEPSSLHDRPVADLICLDMAIRERLEILGCRKVSNVAALSEQALTEQFGKLAPKIIAACAGKDIEAYKANYPNNQISRSQYFQDCITNKLTLHTAISSLCQQAAYELNQRSMSCSKLVVYLESDENDIFIAHRDLKKTATSAVSITQAFISLIEDCPFEFVSGIRIILSEIKTAIVTQTELYLGKRTSFDVQRLERTVQVLKENLGSNTIKVASHIKLERRIRANKYWEKVLGLQP